MTDADLLPPVEPPSAGFIIQLFVVPALIVLLIVGVWLSVSWLVHRTRPQDLISGLEGTGVARWQRASELADILRNERYAAFKRDARAASQLAANLKREVANGETAKGMAPESVKLRFFLCRALGEFLVPEGISELILAADANRSPEEQLVRRGAIQALAMRAYHLREASVSGEWEQTVEDALLRLAGDDDPVVRSETAYALGRIATEPCLKRLEAMAGDPDADTRYNTAIALANHGRAVAVEALAEMLEPVPLESVLEEVDGQSRVRKRTTILQNAMEAVAALAAKNPDADLAPVLKSLKELADADEATLEGAFIPGAAAAEAARLLKLLGD
jgi:HEAT repeat protein